MYVYNSISRYVLVAHSQKKRRRTDEYPHQCLTESQHSNYKNNNTTITLLDNNKSC